MIWNAECPVKWMIHAWGRDQINHLCGPQTCVIGGKSQTSIMFPLHSGSPCWQVKGEFPDESSYKRQMFTVLLWFYMSWSWSSRASVPLRFHMAPEWLSWCPAAWSTWERAALWWRLCRPDTDSHSTEWQTQEGLTGLAWWHLLPYTASEPAARTKIQHGLSFFFQMWQNMFKQWSNKL